MFSKRQINFIMFLVYLLLFIVALLFIYYLVPKILLWLLPFIIAYIFSAISRPLSRLFNKHLRVPLKVSQPISAIIMLLIAGTLITLLIIKIVTEISNLISLIPTYANDIIAFVRAIPAQLNELFSSLPPDVVETINEFINNFSLNMTNMQQLAITALSGVGTIVVSVPSVIIFIFFTIIATVFLSIDRDMIHEWLKRTLPENIYTGIITAKRSFFSAIWGYVRAQLIMYVIVFTELVIGFSILRLDYVVLLALVIAFIDMLPIFGVGTVLLPWGLICIAMQDYRLGVSLLAMYAILFTVRQIIEPKIVSSQIGLHPLLTLLSMYAGLKTFGFLGMILFPIALILLINMYKVGLFDGFKENVLKEQGAPKDSGTNDSEPPNGSASEPNTDSGK
ncbi:MAG: sporulation integral membrane protein YtvI [Clostridia bacterium]|nr:sporulation integral membrane protein YtvI [Clostridia bacterium]